MRVTVRDDKSIPSPTLGALLMVRSDQKGKEFDLGLRSCASYDAPCSVCEIMARSGSGLFRKTSIGDFRRYHRRLTHTLNSLTL